MEVDDYEETLKRAHSDDDRSPSCKRGRYEDLERMMSDTSISDIESDNKHKKMELSPSTRKIQIRRKKVKKSRFSVGSTILMFQFRAANGQKEKDEANVNFQHSVLFPVLANNSSKKTINI